MQIFLQCLYLERFHESHWSQRRQKLSLYFCGILIFLSIFYFGWSEIFQILSNFCFIIKEGILEGKNFPTHFSLCSFSNTQVTSAVYSLPRFCACTVPSYLISHEFWLKWFKVFYRGFSFHSNILFSYVFFHYILRIFTERFINLTNVTSFLAELIIFTKFYTILIILVFTISN